MTISNLHVLSFNDIDGEEAEWAVFQMGQYRHESRQLRSPIINLGLYLQTRGCVGFQALISLCLAFSIMNTLVTDQFIYISVSISLTHVNPYRSTYTSSLYYLTSAQPFPTIVSLLSLLSSNICYHRYIL